MKLSLQPDLVPPHIDGFILESDARGSRFSSVGAPAMSVGGPAAARDRRPEYELHVATRGRARLLVDDAPVVLDAQDMLFIRPQQTRLVIDATDDYLSWVLVFRPRVLRRACTTAASEPLRYRGKSGPPLHRHLTRLTVRRLVQTYRTVPVGLGRDPFNTGLAFAVSYSWLAYTSASLPLLPEAVHPGVRRAAWLTMDSATLSGPELAAACNMSSSRLSRMFKQQMGLPLSEFRNRCRMQYFLSLVQDDAEITLLDAAMTAGFGSYTQFHRVFKRTMQQSPAQYAREQRGE